MVHTTYQGILQVSHRVPGRYIPGVRVCTHLGVLRRTAGHPVSGGVQGVMQYLHRIRTYPGRVCNTLVYLWEHLQGRTGSIQGM